MKTRRSLMRMAMSSSAMALAVHAAGAFAADLPASHTQGQITYLSGGVGESEAAAIKGAAARYALELEFLQKAKPRDEYLAGVNVRIKDAHDKTLLDVKSDGPFLLANMPAGKYVVDTDHNGKSEQRQIDIADKGHRRVVFVWNP